MGINITEIVIDPPPDPVELKRRFNAILQTIRDASNERRKLTDEAQKAFLIEAITLLDLIVRVAPNSFPLDFLSDLDNQEVQMAASSFLSQMLNGLATPS